MKKFLLLGLLLISFCLQAVAQFPPRIDDHFWRRKVVNRIDLNEKINAPLIKRESPFYNDNQYAEKEGLVMALFNGLKANKFVAYHPDSLSTPLTYDDVLRRIQEFEGSLSGGEDDFDDGFGEGDGGFESFDGDEGDDWGFEGDEFGDEFGGDDFGDDLGEDELLGGGGFMGDFDPAPFENVIQFVEDRIFDKNRSDMVYDIQFVEIIWTDPGETLPEKKLCTFAYQDVIESLDNSQWKNRFNDAAYKTLREVFELRLFSSYIIDVSGEGLRSLEEAEYRRQKLIEFEHHLWSY
ncbi:MAG: hypothetical protein AAF399_08780 [Bacteroidota bacterium]